MTPFFRRSANLARKYWFQYVFSLLGCVLLQGTILRYFVAEPLGIASVLVTVLSSFLLMAFVLLGMYLVNVENNRLRLCPYDVHEINHLYRNALGELFASPDQPGSEQLLLIERRVLEMISAKIANMFRTLISRSCVVTVMLLADEGGKKFCFMWARSGIEIRRDGPIRQYAIGSARNLGFDEALKLRPPSIPSHFYGADLRLMQKKGLFEMLDEPEWKQLYQSLIVVPIRQVLPSDDRTELLGFLCLDTPSPNRLNDTYHLQFMAAFADQMYNFMSIMRRRYQFSATKSSISSSPSDLQSHASPDSAA